MKKIISLLCGFCFLVSYSQDAVTIDVLQTPSSPALNMLGVSPSSIDKPTDLTSFATSIQNALTTLPLNYAMEFLPYTLFGKVPMDTEELNTKEIGHVFRQTFTVSVGIANEEAKDEIPASTRIAGGIKFSIIRPHFDDKTIAGINAIEADQAKVIEGIAEINEADAMRNLLESMRDEILALIEKNALESKKAIDILANDRVKNEAAIDSIVKDSIEIEADLDRRLKETNKLVRLRIAEIQKENSEKQEAALKEKIRKGAEDLKFNRAGWFLDFAGGSVLDFKDQTFNKSYVSKSGAWLTGGYDAKKSLDFLAIARYLYQPDKILADDTALLDSKNISTFDGGLRLIYKEMKKQKLSISTEALYRSVLNEKVIDPSWRIVLNATYDLGENQVLSFAFGKDFDNSLIKKDNLIASLNYIIGLGSKRLIKKLTTPGP